VQRVHGHDELLAEILTALEAMVFEADRIPAAGTPRAHGVGRDAVTTPELIPNVA